MKTLTLIQTKKSGLLLEAEEAGEEYEFYDFDGEGGKATKISFAPWNEEYTVVEGVQTAEFDGDDIDSFWAALEIVRLSARENGIVLPEYAVF